jgi:beta-glucanase (GH16 family)
LARLLNLCAPGSAAPTSTATSAATTCQGLQLLLGMCSPAPAAPTAPATTGLQETFWLWPVDAQHYGSWPRSGEIDFAEFFGDYPDRVIPYIHYAYASSDPSTNTNVVTNNTSCKIEASAFNTYDVEWEPGTITVGYNGTTCLTDHYVPNGGLTSPQPFDQPFFVALTQALGVAPNPASATTPLPATTSVDYVRVWK